ncbi:GNAT family N-acetyltransferase [Longitalea luteola]|uniref:GNAT family N-acetyltransferase n=1 Tax=Longitalea luteola TaxID=2812563 RepID=UPI001A975323|nr:GNAT family N-acetyltransferase [Longitalea luteola]
MQLVDRPEGKVFNVPVPSHKTTVVNDISTHYKKASSLELITGAAVIDLLQKPEFQRSWDTLVESCTWSTVFQGRPYITAWYQVYCNRHLPVMVIATTNGQLTGALPMVLLDSQTSDRTKKGNRITGAGHYDAEYQCWLAMPSCTETFIKDALSLLLKQFPGNPISFRYLPPGTPLHWLQNDRKWRRYGILQSYTRPLINLSRPDAAKLLKSRQFRNKLNRLKRVGEVQLEVVTSIERFRNVLDELAVLYDFRFTALFNKHHFRDDPAKKELLQELFRLQLLHATLFKVNGKIFAGVVAVQGKEWVYLSGFSCHSPFKARAYSPGLLHFSFLAKKLQEEKMQFFDLTPGYDSYKEKLANQHDEVHELFVSNELLYQCKKRFRKWMHIRLLAAGIRPMTAEVNLKKYFYRLQNTSLTAGIKKIAKAFQKKAPEKRYEIPAALSMSGNKIALQKDNLNDLLQFKAEKGAGITEWDFLADAMYRFETGEHCFTTVENGRLLHCAWFSAPDAEEKKDAINFNEVRLIKLYCQGAGKAQLSVFLYSVIDAVVAAKNGNYISSANPLFCQVLEGIGCSQVN